MQDKIFELLLDEEEITWQSIIYDLIRSEEMDPWDIDVSTISSKYLSMVKKLSEMNFVVSGKVLLASALLLKIKTDKLVLEDLRNLDQMFSFGDEDEDDDDILVDDIDAALMPRQDDDYKLVPRTPQPRKRKVSVYDLVEALQKAIDTKKRRFNRRLPDAPMKMPEKKVDIYEMITYIYGQIITHYDDRPTEKKDEKMTFSQLIPSDDREDKVFTFIPLLHLANQRLVDLKQPINFAEIDVWLLDPSRRPEEYKEEQVEA